MTFYFLHIFSREYTDDDARKKNKLRLILISACSLTCHDWKSFSRVESSRTALCLMITVIRNSWSSTSASLLLWLYQRRLFIIHTSDSRLTNNSSLYSHCNWALYDWAITDRSAAECGRHEWLHTITASWQTWLWQHNTSSLMGFRFDADQETLRQQQRSRWTLWRGDEMTMTKSHRQSSTDDGPAATATARVCRLSEWASERR